MIHREKTVTKPRQIREKALNMLEHDPQTKVQRCELAIQVHSQEGCKLCEICGQPIPAERIKLYPEMTTCIPCQSLLEKPGLLRAEVARMHHRLMLMKNQYDAMERMERISSEDQDTWRKEIRRYQERLTKLQAALYNPAPKRIKCVDMEGGSHDYT